jgi:cyclin-C
MSTKVEECGMNASRFVKAVHDEKLNLHTSFRGLTVEQVMGCEFECLDALDFDLVIFHPYRDVTQYISDAKLIECHQISWNIVNDAYRTEAILIHPPYLIGKCTGYNCVYDIVCLSCLTIFLSACWFPQFLLSPIRPFL